MQVTFTSFHELYFLSDPSSIKLYIFIYIQNTEAFTSYVFLALYSKWSFLTYQYYCDFSEELNQFYSSGRGSKISPTALQNGGIYVFQWRCDDGFYRAEYENSQGLDYKIFLFEF